MGQTVPRITAGVTTHRPAPTPAEPRLIHRMEARRLVRPTIRAPAPMARLIKLRTAIRTGEVRPSRRMDSRPTHSTTRVLKGRRGPCKPPMVEGLRRAVRRMATTPSPRQPTETSTPPITATPIRTPAAVGRAPTNPTSAIRTPRVVGDKKKVAALPLSEIVPAAGNRGLQALAVGRVEAGEADGVAVVAVFVEVVADSRGFCRIGNTL